MKSLSNHVFNHMKLEAELKEFRALLKNKEELSESQDILPFFRSRKDLSAFIGEYSQKLVKFDLIAHELDLFGDFTCDLVVGDSKKNTYVLVEFEDALKNSLFKANGKKATLEWSNRLEHGFGQIVDWFWKINSLIDTQEMEYLFKSRRPTFVGVLVCGRKSGLGKKELDRLEWRRDKVSVDTNPVICLTFDELLDDLEDSYERYQLLARIDP